MGNKSVERTLAGWIKFLLYQISIYAWMRKLDVKQSVTLYLKLSRLLSDFNWLSVVWYQIIYCFYNFLSAPCISFNTFTEFVRVTFYKLICIHLIKLSLELFIMKIHRYYQTQVRWSLTYWYLNHYINVFTSQTLIYPTVRD